MSKSYVRVNGVWVRVYRVDAWWVWALCIVGAVLVVLAALAAATVGIGT